MSKAARHGGRGETSMTAPGPTAAQARNSAAWFDSPAGRRALEEEAQLLSGVYATLFGYWIVQIGAWGRRDELLAMSKIRGRALIAATRGETSGFIGDPTALALAPDSVDAVLLPHTLERSVDPHAVLREAERVLVGEGCLLIFGFSPLSFWGIRRLASRSAAPWAGRYIGEGRIRNWLKVLGFEVEHTVRYLHGIPAEHPALLRRLQFTRGLGRRCYPGLAGGWFIVARKRVTTLTPIRPAREKRKRALVGSLAHPSTRTAPPCPHT
jgi:SAM-dependent methyltransferase